MSANELHKAGFLSTLLPLDIPKDRPDLSMARDTAPAINFRILLAATIIPMALMLPSAHPVSMLIPDEIQLAFSGSTEC